MSARSSERTCLYFRWKPVDDVSSSPRSLSPPPRAISPQRSEVSANGICPPAVSGCASSNERGPPEEFVRRRDCSLSPLLSFKGFHSYKE